MSGHPRFRELTEDELRLHDEKNADYAGGGDPLGNFHRVADILANYPELDLADPTVVCIVYALKQLDAALWMLSEGYEGQVENVDTRLRDVHVYMKLARILHEETIEDGHIPDIAYVWLPEMGDSTSIPDYIVDADGTIRPYPRQDTSGLGWHNR